MSYENTSLTTNLDDRGPSGGDNAGAVGFAGVLLIMIGLFHALQGIVALAGDEFFVVTKTYVFNFDFTTWGWAHLVVGLATAAAGAGLFWGATWARTVAVIAAAVSLVASFMWLPHYPLWSLVIMGLDVFVIWAVIVHGRALVEE